MPSELIATIQDRESVVASPSNLRVPCVLGSCSIHRVSVTPGSGGATRRAAPRKMAISPLPGWIADLPNAVRVVGCDLSAGCQVVRDARKADLVPHASAIAWG